MNFKLLFPSDIKICALCFLTHIVDVVNHTNGAVNIIYCGKSFLIDMWGIYVIEVKPIMS